MKVLIAIVLLAFIVGVHSASFRASSDLFIKNKVLENEQTGGLLYILFTNPEQECSGCKEINDKFAEMSEQYSDKVTWIVANVDDVNGESMKPYIPGYVMLNGANVLEVIPRASFVQLENAALTYIEKQKTIRKRYNTDDDDDETNDQETTTTTTTTKTTKTTTDTTVKDTLETKDGSTEQVKENIVKVAADSADEPDNDESSFIQFKSKVDIKKKPVNTFKSTTTTKKSTTSSPSTTSILSFDEDQNDDSSTFSIRNQSLKSIKMSSMKRNDLNIQSTAATSSFYNQSIGEYTVENLNKLKIATTSRSTVPPNKEEQDESMTTMVGMDTRDEEEDGKDGDTDLPTIEQIKAAKEKRERLRREHKDRDNNNNNNNGFIPLDSRKKNNSNNNNNNNNNNSNKPIIDIDMESDNEDDDSANEYDQEKSNVRKFGDTSASSKTRGGVDDTINVDSDEEDSEVRRWHIEQIQKGGGISSKASLDSKSKSHQKDLLHQTKEDYPQRGGGSTTDNASGYAQRLLRDIESALEGMDEVQFSHKSDLSRSQAALEDSQYLVMRLESDLNVIDDEVNYYYEFEDYVKNMEGCLDEKIPQIEELESRMMDLESHYFGSKGKPMTSEQEVEEEEAFYQKEKRHIQELSQKVLEDVDDEYSQLELVRDKFQNWKQKNYSSYKKINLAYIIPAIFAPFIKLQLLQWNPLQDSNFDKYPWFSQLSNYGILKNIELDHDDQDHNLIPKLVSKIIVTKVEYFIKSIWDPYSATQTNNLIHTIEEILIYVEQLPSYFFNLIIQRILKSIEQIKFRKENTGKQENQIIFDGSISLLLVMVRFHKLFDSDSKYTLGNHILDYVNSIILTNISQTSLLDEPSQLLLCLRRVVDSFVIINNNNEKKRTCSNMVHGLLIDVESLIESEDDINQISYIKDKLSL
ncbi:GC-rich sequence DNA-binding factor-like protein [Cavenderia fasciculata]|uniref:GC-rich sequence DNA-binding factor-like protein n=1 Tax=Cavenderia fasciculata TaxID=261658 RepID=F4PRL5_CACFS|nr:GC-rich sequence DNA-binding factor-like protein [Cavenderia fasciculata]EGG21355.1 GC-rich sequence DNA-binding factor-like protein [Cavenderia fasciculata]|eukprot:XP_004359205.1 GC-rich sequence DNA-binding factor-like protein [Cavenderia fasciculata]